MLEIERLLNEGFIPRNFINEEERSGFKVTISRKKIWSIELDLLREFDRVCKKHNLTYYAFGGTLLGLVRHQGFIPWDDDIDVVMMRDQYDKLCEIAPSEFSFPYFFQTQSTDFGYRHGFAKLRNSNTTCLHPFDLQDSEHVNTLNKGIFIDIFPADNVIDDHNLFKKQEMEAKIYKKIAIHFSTSTKEGYRWYPNPLTRIVHCLIKNFCPMKYRIVNYFWKKHELTCRKYNGKKTDYMSILCLSFKKRWWQRKQDYSTIIEMPFEFVKLPLCSNYDHALTSCYGDWHKFVRGTSLHEGLIFDTEQPYAEFQKNIISQKKSNNSKSRFRRCCEWARLKLGVVLPLY